MSDLRDNCKAIKKELDFPVNHGDIVSVQDKLIRLTCIASLSAECMATAKKELLVAQLDAIKSSNDLKLTPTIQSKLVDGMCSNQHEMYVLCDRQNAAITHTQDSLRSIISLYKTELQNNLA